MNKIEMMFNNKGINRHGVVVYPQIVAIDFIKECKKNSIPVLGVDALILKGDFTQPSMENSIDFTLDPYKPNMPQNTWEVAINFIKSRDPQYYYEIVCG